MDRTLADAHEFKAHPRWLIKFMRDDARWDTATIGDLDMLLLDRWLTEHAESHSGIQLHMRIASQAA